MEKQALLLVVALFLLPLAVMVVGSFAAAFIEHDYPWADMDWDEDGHTTAGELFRSVDIGVRETRLNGRDRREYFDFKDGSTVRVVPVRAE